MVRFKKSKNLNPVLGCVLLLFVLVLLFLFPKLKSGFVHSPSRNVSAEYSNHKFAYTKSGKVFIYDPATSQNTLAFNNISNALDVQWSPDGKLLTVANDAVYFYDPLSKTQKRILDNFKGTLWGWKSSKEFITLREFNNKGEIHVIGTGDGPPDMSKDKYTVVSLDGKTQEISLQQEIGIAQNKTIFPDVHHSFKAIKTPLPSNPIHINLLDIKRNTEYHLDDTVSYIKLSPDNSSVITLDSSGMGSDEIWKVCKFENIIGANNCEELPARHLTIRPNYKWIDNHTLAFMSQAEKKDEYTFNSYDIQTKTQKAIGKPLHTVFPDSIVFEIAPDGKNIVYTYVETYSPDGHEQQYFIAKVSIADGEETLRIPNDLTRVSDDLPL